ncbi:MAG: tetraacyldisaccharide 4'-kinase [Bacteroidales bacterium]|nr:tetraacyldisaccharide 4'-kinase [Bacteroidales bacterium]
MISSVVMFPYWLVLRIRHALFDGGKLKSVTHPVPVISVGNLTVGGTGKTPMVEYLVALLQGRCRVAVLSRGYKRKGKGFHLVEADDTALTAGDEPLQIKRKFPHILVAVDKDRNRGVRQLLALPEDQRPDLVILDDGFQYRRLKPQTDLVMVDYNRPIFKDNLLPFGRLRDLPEQIRRAKVVVVSKSPRYLDEWERAKVRQQTRLRPDQPLFFTMVKYGEALPVFRWEADKRYIYSKEVFLFSGVADDRPLVIHLTDRYERIAHKRYGDHHRFTASDLRWLDHYARNNPRALLLTTEKDAMRLLHDARLSNEVRRRLFYLPIEPEFLSWEEGEAFDNLLLGDVPEKAGSGLLF